MLSLDARLKCANPSGPRFSWLVIGILSALQFASAQSININCGGNQYTATDGTVWIGDRYWVGGANYWASQNIGNTTDPWMYRSARYSLYGDFYYDVPVNNGSYDVKLKFSENQYWGTGYRVFHVAINSTRVLDSFDIAAQAGGARLAIDKTFPVSVTNGKIRIDFTGVKEKGMVSAIQITPSAGGAGTSTPVSVSVAPQNPTVSQGQTQTFTATVTGNSNTSVTWSVSGTAPTGSISAAGVYTAPTGLTQNNSITVTATSVADTSKSASTTVTVPGSAPVVSISVSPASTSVGSGGTAQFAATVTGSSNTAATWAASAGSISSSGLLTAPSVTAVTTLTVTARSAADTTKTATATVTVNPPATSSSGSGAWIESGGLVSMEAENGRVVNRAQSWNFRSDVLGFTGAGFLRAEPNNGTLLQTATEYVGVAPEVQFPVRFTRTGTYYIWVRGYGETDVDDSLHVGLDGAAVSTGETISQFPLNPSAWGWTNYAMDYVRRSTVVVSSPGLHTINVWMREDGMRIDKIVLSNDPNFSTSGAGPTESSRETTSSTTPVLTLSTNSLSFSGTVGGSAPAAKTVTVSNTGSGTLSWTAASNQTSWLQVTPGSGTNAGTLSISVVPGSLTAGTYNGAITVTASGAAQSPGTISVSFSLTSSTPATPTMTLSQTSLSLSAITGSSTPTTQTVNVGFTSGTPAWTASKNQSWLGVSPASGSGNATVTISANPTNLAAGTYTDVVTFDSPGSINSPNSVNVTLTVQAAPTSSSGRNFYVAPTGSSSGDGSLAKPWDFRTAMGAKSTIKPGDTIWIRGGTYGDGTGSSVLNVNFLGTAAQPILIRAYPGERAVVQHPLIIGCCDGAGDPSLGQHMWFWGLEFTSPITDRTGCASGPPCYASSVINPAMHVFAPGARIINNIIHDTMQGISMWTEAVDGEAYGNIIYHNGFHATDRGHGHGIYTQNNTGVKKLRENIIFNQFGWGLHIYGSGNAWVRNFFVEGNVSFNNGSPEGYRTDNILVAGGQGGGAGIVVQNNHFYHTPSTQMGYNEVGWQWSNSNEDASVTNNYFIGGRDAFDSFAYKKMTFTGNTLLSYSNQLWLEPLFGTSQYVWDNNRYFGISSVRLSGSMMDLNAFKGRTGFDQNSTYSSSTPTGVWTFVRPNRCEAGRGHIVIYNWSQASTVQVDLSSILTAGMQFEIRDAQNFNRGPLVSGTYNGGNITVPMTGLTLAAPNGVFPYIPAHTAPDFGTFIVLVPGSSSKTC